MKEPKYDIDRIIAHYLIKSISDEELVYLNQWISESGHNKRMIDHIKKIWEEESKSQHYENEDEIAGKIWEKANHYEKYKSKNNSNFNYLYKVAAILVLVFSIVLVIYKFQSAAEDNQEIISYNYVIKENPAGQKSQIMLPDGTKVWLNADSKLTFPEKFNDSVRFVELTGEAFFDVAEDTSRSFTVKSGEINTTALGTSFNISAFDPEENVKVCLVTGKVKVSHPNAADTPIFLEEGSAVEFNESFKLPKIFKFDINKTLAWKNGTIIFEDDSYDEFIQKIKRWYGVEVTTYGTAGLDWDLNAEFSNTYLKNILDNVSYAKEFKYELDDKDLTIWFDEK